MRRREFESLPVLLFIDNSAHQIAPMRAPCAAWSAVTYLLAMQESRVQLPLGALQSPEQAGSLANIHDVQPRTVCFGLAGRT